MAGFDARGQQAATTLAQGLFRAVVHGQRPLGVMEEGNPTLAPLELVGLGHEQRAFFFAFKDAPQHRCFSTAGDHQRNARPDHDLRRLNLRSHPAYGGGARRSARELFEVPVDQLDRRENARLGRSETFHDPIDRGEDHQQVGRQERRHQRGKRVVVSELQLGDGDGVVFIDDGHDTVAKQGDQRVAGVEVTFVVLEVLMGQQHLAHMQVEFGKQPLVGGHEAGLADRRAGLQGIKGPGPLVVTEQAHARAHRAGSDQDHFAARLTLRGHLPHQLFHLREIRMLAAVRQDAGAQLHDQAADVLQGLETHRDLRFTIYDLRLTSRTPLT